VLAVLVGWQVGWLAVWMAGWLGGWVAGWLGGWLAGWLVAQRNPIQLKLNPTLPQRNSTQHNSTQLGRPLNTLSMSHNTQIGSSTATQHDITTPSVIERCDENMSWADEVEAVEEEELHSERVYVNNQIIETASDGTELSRAGLSCVELRALRCVALRLLS